MINIGCVAVPLIIAQTWLWGSQIAVKEINIFANFVKILNAKGTLNHRLLHLKILSNILYEVTVYSNLIGFPVGEINQIDCKKQCFSLKYFQNALTRKTA